MNADKFGSILDKFAAQHNVSKQQAIDMYFFERFLYRLSLSKYKEFFVFKGGFLLESILGIDNRTTMDLDFSAPKTKYEQEGVIEIIQRLCDEDFHDGIIYEYIEEKDILKAEKYFGKSVVIEAKRFNLKKRFSIDIAFGDVITPRPQVYEYVSQIEDLKFELFAYNKESIIAEKFQTLISKGVENSRAKDFYDLYLLIDENLNYGILNSAIINTFNKRQTKYNKEYIKNVIEELSSSFYLQQSFSLFIKKNDYANKTTYEKVLAKIKSIVKHIEI